MIPADLPRKFMIRGGTAEKSEECTLHRVGRVLSFFSVVGMGTLPTPHPQASVPPPPPVLGGGAHSLAREGLGESQFRRGDIHCGTLYIYVLCARMPQISTYI
jgi:hypothetical protein